MEESSTNHGHKSTDIPGMDELLSEDRKLEAIKLLMEHTGMSLKEAKELVDGLKSSPTGASSRSSRRESIRAQRKNGRTVVTYKGDDGVEQEVTPDHPLWERVKSRMQGNAMIEAYEAEHAATATGSTPIEDSVFVANDRAKRALYLKIALVVAVAAMILYAFLK